MRSLSTSKESCEKCAQSKGLTLEAPKGDGASQISWIDLIASANGENEGEGAEDVPDLTCPRCKTTYREFRATGRLGCPYDYEAFESALVPLLEKIHHGVRHEGKQPGQAAPPPQIALKLAALREKLRTAVQAEQYETAAELRDQIRTLEAQPRED